MPGSTPLRRRHRRRWALVLGGVVAVAVVAILFLLPIPYGFAYVLGSPPHCGPDVQTHSFPTGASVQGSWHSVTSNITELLVIAPNGTLISESSGSAGSFSFRASGGSYQFELWTESSHLLTGCVPSGTAFVNGTYSTPWL